MTKAEQTADRRVAKALETVLLIAQDLVADLLCKLDDNDIPEYGTAEEALKGLVTGIVKDIWPNRHKPNWSVPAALRLVKTAKGSVVFCVAVSAPQTNEAWSGIMAEIDGALFISAKCSAAAMPILDFLRRIHRHLEGAEESETGFRIMQHKGNAEEGALRGNRTGRAHDRWNVICRIASFDLFGDVLFEAAQAVQKILGKPERPSDRIDERMTAELKRVAAVDRNGTVSMRALVQIAGIVQSTVRRRLERIPEVQMVRKGQYRWRPDGK